VPSQGEQGYSLLVLLAVLVGAMLGIGLYTFGYAQGASYITDNPAACVNCHVMREQFESWMKSSHARVAVCNDCHTPPGLVPRYTTKAVNGFFHAWAFTTGWFPDQIRITDRNIRVTESSCIKCHEGMVHGIRGTRGPRHQDVSCIACHARVGHM
jgi:cytochrome c nitrite reductase small subunit